jgi:hypothetical protein
MRPPNAIIRVERDTDSAGLGSVGYADSHGQLLSEVQSLK